MEHAGGTAPANPGAPTDSPITASAGQPVATEEHHSASPHVTNLTGGDKVIGPNAPVGILHSEKPHPIQSDEPSTTSHLTESTEKPESVKGNVPAGTAAIAEKGAHDGATAETDSAENTVDEQNDDSKYPGGGALAVLTFGLCMATFVVALDNTIIATAIPKVRNKPFLINAVGFRFPRAEIG